MASLFILWVIRDEKKSRYIVHYYSCCRVWDCIGAFNDYREYNCIALSPETCPPLNLSDGMVPSSENRTVGTVITFSCNPGKQVSEDIATACFPGGNWSAPNLPTCVDGT